MSETVEAGRLREAREKGTAAVWLRYAAGERTAAGEQPRPPPAHT